MARIRQLTKLFQAIASNDLNIAENVAAEIAVDEERMGHHVAAQLLRGSLRPNSRGEGRVIETNNGILQQSKILSPALTLVANPTRIDDVMLTRHSQQELAEVVKEWKYSKQLRALKIRTRNRLFFYGPPGCGKSLTAQALGHEMSLPTYVVRFDAVIGAYLGQTALHLRELFRFAEQTPCVLVFDEVDALAKQRGNPLDVGELDRIVISFMQELEHSWARRQKADRISRFIIPQAIGRDKSKKPAEDSTGLARLRGGLWFLDFVFHAVTLPFDDHRLGVVEETIEHG